MWIVEVKQDWKCIITKGDCGKLLQASKDKMQEEEPLLIDVISLTAVICSVMQNRLNRLNICLCLRT